MKRTITLAAGLFVAGLYLAPAPASAVPFAVPTTTEASPAVETVQYGYGRRGYGYGRRGYGGGYGRRGYGGGPRYGGRGYYGGGGYGRGSYGRTGIGPGNLLGGGPGYVGPRF